MAALFQDAATREVLAPILRSRSFCPRTPEENRACWPVACPVVSTIEYEPQVTSPASGDPLGLFAFGEPRENVCQFLGWDRSQTSSGMLVQCLPFRKGAAWRPSSWRGRCASCQCPQAWRLRQLPSLIGFSHESHAIFQFFVEKATV